MMTSYDRIPSGKVRMMKSFPYNNFSKYVLLHDGIPLIHEISDSVHHGKQAYFTACLLKLFIICIIWFKVLDYLFIPIFAAHSFQLHLILPEKEQNSKNPIL